MNELEDIFIPLAFFASVVLIVFFTVKYSHKTKMAILEKGGSLDTTKKKLPFLEIGLILLGIGLGLIISFILQSFNLAKESKDLLTGACVLLFGGAGLVSAFFIRRKIEKQQG